MSKNNELISEVKLERLGADILTEVIGFNQDTSCEYLDVEKVNVSVLSNIANYVIKYQTEQLVDFLLWKQSYKEQIEDKTYNSMVYAITHHLSDESSNYMWDAGSKKYLLKTSTENTDSNLEFVKRVVEHLFDYHSDSPYMFVRKKDVELNLKKEADNSLYRTILTISNLDTDISKLSDSVLKYSIAPVVNEYLESKGYYFDKDENRYYIPIDEDKKYSMLKDVLENHFMAYSENEYGFVVSTNEGNKELYIDSCSQYTISDDATAYHYNEEREFLIALDNIAVKRIPFLEQKKFTLKKALNKNNISYSNRENDAFIINTTEGVLSLYIDSNGFYCSEDDDGYGTCKKFIPEFIEYINSIYIFNENTTSDTSNESSCTTLECTTYLSAKHNWVLHETKTFDDLKGGACIDGHLEILDIKNGMKLVSDNELNKFGYDDVWDVEWTVISQSSNKIAN